MNKFSVDIHFEFGDTRVNRRANFMVNKMIKLCGKPISQVFSKGADLKGTYRFLDNNLVTPTKVLDPHINETIKRCKEAGLVAIIQDSTDLDYDYLESIEGFNSLHVNVEKGFRLHPSLAINEKGVPLGILETFNYTRNEEPKKHRNSLKIEEKESYRWLQGYRIACKLADQGVQVISIADREADIYECLAEATQGSADILVRSQHNRTLANEEINNKLEKKLIRCPIVYEAEILLNRYRKNERIANVAIRASKVLIQAPSNKKSQPPIEVNAILVSEIEPGENPLHWLLLTTLSIDSPEEIKSIISWYSKRWCIEIFFKTLKSGCKIDSPRLQTTCRIENFIALSMIVAWKVMLATYLPRQYPNEPCTCLLTEIEWKLAYKEVYNKKPPIETPNLKESAMLVAMLGGYQKRKEPPGIQTMWRGMARLANIVRGYELAQEFFLSQ